MKQSAIKTIDVDTRTWFDKVNGNTYFAQEITINYGMKNAVKLYNPFQYGYSSYGYEAFKFLQETFKWKKSLHERIIGGKIIVREHLQRGCKKKEL